MTSQSMISLVAAKRMAEAERDYWKSAYNAASESYAAVVALLSKAGAEIENLQRKIAAGEQEGWEGSQRRLLLKRQISDNQSAGEASAVDSAADGPQ